MILRVDSAGRSMRVPIVGQGYRKRLWRRTSAEFMENLWNSQAEGDVVRVLAKLDAGQALTLNDKKLLIRFLAVHYVRSNEFIRVYERVHQSHLAKAVADPRLSLAQRYQLRLQLMQEMSIPSEFFESMMRDYYDKCLRYLSKFGLEIGVATGEETFILPDGGLLVMDRAGKAQPTGGVALLSSTTALMPLGPRHIAAFSSGTRKITYRPLDDAEVTIANTNLKFGVVSAYYKQPPVV